VRAESSFSEEKEAKTLLFLRFVGRGAMYGGDYSG
jgi:hypothetical protein